jgi:outer membrane protein TolC
LIAIIDTALKNNQELNIALREIEIDKNEIQARKGEYLPFVNLAGVTGVEKTGRYTWDGLSEEDLKANPEKGPKYIGDFRTGVYASWELDVWKKLRNAKKSAVVKYYSTIEGRNFMVTNLISEIAGSYYELLALDNMMSILQQNIELQKNALQMVKLEKEAAKVSQLALLPQGAPERESRVLNMVAQMDKENFGNCTNTYACEAECPKGISVANIARMNKEYLHASLTTES